MKTCKTCERGRGLDHDGYLDGDIVTIHCLKKNIYTEPYEKRKCWEGKPKPNPEKVLRKTMDDLIKSRGILLKNWLDEDLKWTDPYCEAACHAIEQARDILETELHRQWEEKNK